ncbi:MAG: FG-GAP repeat protein [Planctomycetes bacterium]|nr:FG-GAP repeat protein [Planctomycetota bacterium]
MIRSLAALALAALVASPALAQHAPSTWPLDTLSAYDGQPAEIFGAALDAHGDLLAVGAQQFSNSVLGKVYVYRRVANAWSLEDEFLPLTNTFTQLGYSVAVSGDRIVAGAPFENNPGGNEGAVYVWHHDGVAWSLEAHLVQANFANAGVGEDVAIDGDVIVSGAPYESIGGVQTGAAYVWRRIGGTWTLEATLAPTDVSTITYYGSAVAIEGDLIAVGARSAPGLVPTSGAVYVYERSGGTWTQTDKLVGSALGSSQPHQFGNALDIDGGRIAVGCYAFLGVGQASGLVYQYEKVGSAWTEVAHVECSDAAPFTLFGASLDLDGGRLLVGSTGQTAALVNAGAMYLFEQVGGEWLERARLVESVATGSDQLGRGVAFAGGLAVGGAWAYASGAGAVHTFDATLPAAVGTGFCFGDGSGTPCPCGNDAPLGSGRGCVNGTGVGAWLELVGTSSLSAGDLAPYVHAIPAKQPCLLFAGLNAVNGGLGNTFGDGLRCVGGSVVRLGVGSGGATGVAAWAPAVSLGQSWPAGTQVRLQAWYRDPGAGACGQGFNLTNGVELGLAP